MSWTHDPDVEYREFDFAYPVLTYDRFGTEFQWQFFQLFSVKGGAYQDDNSSRRFTIFPIYFQQRSTDPAREYTALLPLYGHLKNRLYRDKIHFVLFPIYAWTLKRGVETYNMPYPFFHLRYGEKLHGWQVWPLVGREHKDVTSRTNGFGETEVVGGHDKSFVLWPFFTDSRTEIGTENPIKQQGLIPIYTFYRSPLRDSTTYFWPLGVTHTIDREKKFEEWDAPWPLIEFARGEGKTVSRVWPFFSRGHNDFLEKNWYMWPVYTYQRVLSAPLDRERTRILFFLYSDVSEKNTETGRELRRRDFWPLYTHKREFDGSSRFQMLAIIEPLLPNNKSMERNYSPLYSFWRAEKNSKTGATSQSLLWNLYRRESTPETKNISLLFGLFQYQSGPEGARWRVFHIPAGGSKARRAESPGNK